MKRILLTSLIVSALSLSVKAQEIDSIFVSSPEAVLPMLEYNSRLDMLDLYNCGLPAKVYNDLGGESCLVKKDDSQFVVQTTDRSTLQLRVLGEGKDTIYSCIRTVQLPEKQSQILFLDNKWNPVRVDIPERLSWEKCWVPNDSLSEDRIETLRLALLPERFYMHWESDEQGNALLICEVSADGLMENDRKDALRCLRPIVFKWNRGHLESK